MFLYSAVQDGWLGTIGKTFPTWPRYWNDVCHGFILLKWPQFIDIKINMPANFNEFDRIVGLIEKISPDPQMRKYDIENLQTLVELSTTITLQDRQQLSIRLFYLGREVQTVQTSKKESKKLR